MSAPPRPSRRQVRNLQRTTHLVAGAALLAYVYLGPLLGDGLTATVQWVVLPVLIGTGIALWKWPRIRRRMRGRG